MIITGEGRGFCSGGDVEAIIGELLEQDMAQLLAFTRMTGALIREHPRVPKPVIAAINGVAAGAGAVIALAADFRLAVPRRASRSCSRRSGSPAPTWARPTCCRASSAWRARPSC